MAYAAFAIGCVSSLMYVFLFDEVRAKHLGFFYNRLPPLVTLDSLNHRTASIGFLLLTAGIVSGALWSSQAWGTFWRWDPKLTAALITWFIYAIHLYVRLVAGWAGKRASYFSIIGFLLALVTFIVIGIVQPGKHGF
jgi:ABC-type transport system involved in cytochrome c biogenesis permease subunit